MRETALSVFSPSAETVGRVSMKFGVMFSHCYLQTVRSFVCTGTE
jgi:hypothetical protein